MLGSAQATMSCVLFSAGFTLKGLCDIRWAGLFRGMVEALLLHATVGMPFFWSETCWTSGHAMMDGALAFFRNPCTIPNGVDLLSPQNKRHILAVLSPLSDFLSSPSYETRAPDSESYLAITTNGRPSRLTHATTPRVGTNFENVVFPMTMISEVAAIST